MRKPEHISHICVFEHIGLLCEGENKGISGQTDSLSIVLIKFMSIVNKGIQLS